MKKISLLEELTFTPLLPLPFINIKQFYFVFFSFFFSFYHGIKESVVKTFYLYYHLFTNDYSERAVDLNFSDYSSFHIIKANKI